MLSRRWRNYFQGVGGAGAPPFFQGVGGAGAPPFFHGVGGAGAPPLAMITEPLPLPATAVFSPIAPTRITNAATTVSFFDIVPPRDTTIPEALYLFRHQCQEVRRADHYFFIEKWFCPFRLVGRPAVEEESLSTARMVGVGSAFHNSTVVL